MGRFENKVVIVTGSSNGIGRATAILFAEEGAKVTITGRSEEALNATRDEILKVGAKAEDIHYMLGDLTNETIQKKLIESTVEKFGKIDILVNNAGGTAIDNSKEQGFDLKIENYDYIMGLNARAVLVLTQLALPHLIKSQGEIIMVSSVAGLNTAGITLPYYCMSKGALDQLMRALAVKYIEQGVRVNSVNPGLITTTIMQKQGATPDQQSKKEEFLTSDWKLIPARRAGTSRDIAQAIAFLADRQLSSYIVGHTLVVDGGSSIVNPLLVNYTIDK